VTKSGTHQSLWDIGANKWHGSGLVQYINKRRIVFSRLSDPRCVAWGYIVRMLRFGAEITDP
jgi:hypothetical protein